jgi:predicted Rossmann fold nucleotide-binding protein DprA/Smf involved in DNA uptake
MIEEFRNKWRSKTATPDAKPYPIHPGAHEYPRALLRGSQPPTLYAIGNDEILRQPITAIFCSNKCPGTAILRALDLAAELRDTNRAVISGFHTPVEKECLAILLRGKSPIVICPARSLHHYRIPFEWKPAITEGRLLLISRFPASAHRVTTNTAQQRNELVAALATEITVLHAAPGGRIAALMQKIERARSPTVSATHGNSFPHVSGIQKHS